MRPLEHGHVALALGEHARAPEVLNAGVLLLVVRAAAERYALSTVLSRVDER